MNSQSPEFQGVISEFKLDSGKIQLQDGRVLNFKASEFLEQIGGLSDYPAIYCQVENDMAVRIRHNPDLVVLKPARSGLAVLGAAKCPSCDWRLPIMASKPQVPLRKQKSVNCPGCDTSIYLDSMVNGFHTPAIFSLFLIFVFWNRGVKIITRSGAVELQPEWLLALSSIVYLSLLVALFWIFWQEKLFPGHIEPDEE